MYPQYNNNIRWKKKAKLSSATNTKSKKKKKKKMTKSVSPPIKRGLSRAGSRQGLAAILTLAGKYEALTSRRTDTTHCRPVRRRTGSHNIPDLHGLNSESAVVNLFLLEFFPLIFVLERRTSDQ
jgi:hypothetical protein